MYITKSHFDGVFACFFRNTAIKGIFFSVCWLFLLTITCINEAIIVELKLSIVLNRSYQLFWGFPSLDFSHLRKQVLEEVSRTSMLWPLLIFFVHRCHYFYFCKKMKIDYVHCSMRKFWRPSLTGT